MRFRPLVSVWLTPSRTGRDRVHNLCTDTNTNLLRRVENMLVSSTVANIVCRDQTTALIFGVASASRRARTRYGSLSRIYRRNRHSDWVQSGSSPSMASVSLLSLTQGLSPTACTDCISISGPTGWPRAKTFAGASGRAVRGRRFGRSIT